MSGSSLHGRLGNGSVVGNQKMKHLTPKELGDALQLMLFNELRMWRFRLSGQKMRILDLGCFPWHGYLELSFLTTHEPQMKGIRDKKACTGNWRLYDFPHTFVSGWPQAIDLAKRMKRTYAAYAEPAAFAQSCFEACARALRSKQVARALSDYRLTDDFELRVLDPDDSHSRNYCQPRPNKARRVSR